MHERSAVATAAVVGAPSTWSRFAEQLGRHGVLTLHVGTVAGDGWLPLLPAPGDLRRWHATLARDRDGLAAAATLASWIAAAPALVVGLPAVFAQVVPGVDLADLAVRRDAEGVVTGYACATAAASGGDEATVLRRAADTIARLTSPLVSRLRAELPVGAAAIRGAATDGLASYALWFARRSGADEPATWDRVDRLIGLLAGRIPSATRPRSFPVTWSGGTSLFPVRGTCCLYHRTCDEEVRGEDRYCATCPLRSDASRTASLAAYLEAST